jgi:hypothetical protein
MRTEKDSYVIRLTIDMSPKTGVRQILIMSETPEGREAGLRKVDNLLALIELLEQEAQRSEIACA